MSRTGSDFTIFLTGFMGSGKSTVGRRLAQRLGFSFVDLDQLLVEREGRSIPEIFAAHGEAYFRDCESALLAEQAGSAKTVYATGGGIVGRQENLALMKRAGTVIYLRLAWPTLERRLSRASGRPLADPKRGVAAIRQLWQSRLPWYEEADLVIDADRLNVNGVVDAIVKKLMENRIVSGAD
jgi:shikimate kinase